MKRSVLLTALFVSIPTFVLFTFGPIPAVGLISIVGIVGILLADYDMDLIFRREPTSPRAKQRLPLFA
jgi:xanthosine utilization system XapX-like protein